MSEKLNGTYIENASLIFGEEMFSGGRLGLDRTGVVKVCFEPDREHQEIFLSLYDNMSLQDGHYSPVSLSYGQAETLRDWLTFQLEKLKAD